MSAGVTASFLAAAAEAVEAARLEDDSLACGNLAGLLSHIYLAGLTDCGLIFSLLDQLRARFRPAPVLYLQRWCMQTCSSVAQGTMQNWSCLDDSLSAAEIHLHHPMMHPAPQNAALS